MNPRTAGMYGRCWAFPPSFNVQLGVSMEEDYEDIQQSLQVLFSTEPGERIMRPGYGCDLQSIMFENINQNLIADITTKITDSILRYEQRVQVEYVSVRQHPQHLGNLQVQLLYRIRGADTEQQWEGRLDIGEGRGGSTLSNEVLRDQDALQFAPMFGNRQVTVTGPAVIRGSGKATINQRRMCVLGDEKKVQVAAQYMIPGYSPGMGMLTIAALAANQQASRCLSGPAVLLKGQQFIARFSPTQPAIMTALPNTPDPLAPSMGQGQFMASQTFVSAG